MDLIYMAGIAALLALALGLTAGCAKLSGRNQGGRP
ncbi:MAG TPA: potassium ABC transporter ATPase [Trinickia sp.]